MSADTFYLLAAPRDLPQLLPWDAFPALLACRLGPGPELLCPEGAGSVRGGVLVVSDCPQPLGGPAQRLCPELLHLCLRHGVRGLLLDFEQKDEGRGRLVCALARLLSGRGVTLFVPEYYAPVAPKARVLVSSALSGGSLEDRLRGAVAQYGADRVVLALEKSAEDFSLPAPDGCGTPLTEEQLGQMRARLRPSVWFSAPLCARYFTYRTDSGSVRFVLFDDTDTLLRKLDTARKAGIRRFLLPWPEVCSCPESFGLGRR